MGDDSTDSGEDDSAEGKSIEAMTMTLESLQGTRSPKGKRDATSSVAVLFQFQTCLEIQTVFRVTHMVAHTPGVSET